MAATSSALRSRTLWPWLATVAVFVVAAALLRLQGRLWTCACGYVWLWSGDIRIGMGLKAQKAA